MVFLYLRCPDILFLLLVCRFRTRVAYLYVAVSLLYSLEKFKIHSHCVSKLTSTEASLTHSFTIIQLPFFAEVKNSKSIDPEHCLQTL